MKLNYFLLLAVLLIVAFSISGCTKQENTTGGQPEASEDSVGEKDNGLPETNPLSVVGKFHYVTAGELGSYHITGKVKNESDAPVIHARAKVKFHDSAGKETVYDEVIVSPSRLAAGQTGAFDVTVGLSKNYDIGNYEATASTFLIEDKAPYTALEISNIQTKDLGDYFKASATVTNTGNEQAPMYNANAIFYDSEGNVITTGTDYTAKEFEGLKAGASKDVSFTVSQPSEEVRITSAEVIIDFSK